MAIQSTGAKLHWNYFLALERDLDVISRYVEFTKENFPTYSIEIAHLLLAACSEVDVVAKLLCERVSPGVKKRNIDDYRAILLTALPGITKSEVMIPRHGLSFRPWANWGKGKHPNWWKAHNKVKHERDTHFDKANLGHTLKALGGLLVVTHYYYSLSLAGPHGGRLDHMETVRALEPRPTLMRLRGDFYYEATHN